MVQGGEGDIESAQGIGPPPPPAEKGGGYPGGQVGGLPGEPGGQSPFTPDHNQHPGPNQPPPTLSRPQEVSLETVKLSEDDVREALAEYVMNLEGCCISKGALKNMVVTEIKPVMAVHYRLETFNEWRGTGWTTVPYYGDGVSAPGSGRTPGGWEMDINPDEPFTNHVKTTEMPHTATVVQCTKCGGSGSERCRHCAGSGTKTCDSCMGKGTKKELVTRGQDRVYEERKCGSCDNGMRRCSWCSGSGNNTCSNCSGKGQIKRFLQLFVKFSNNVKDYVYNDPSFPDELVQDVQGDVLFSEAGMNVEPVKDFPQPEINKASQDLIAQYNRERYQQNTESERQLGQRHNIRGVPVTHVRYRYDGLPRHFWVYGRERRVHCPDYPRGSCARCCELLCGRKGETDDNEGKLKRCLAVFLVFIPIAITIGGIIVLGVVQGNKS